MTLLGFKTILHKNVGPAKIQRVQQNAGPMYVQQNENKFQKVWSKAIHNIKQVKKAF
jgi:hypothetical protein